MKSVSAHVRLLWLCFYRNLDCTNELFVLLLEVGTLLMPYGYAMFGGLKGVSGRGEEAHHRAVGPH